MTAWLGASDSDDVVTSLLRQRAESAPDARFLDFGGTWHTYSDVWDRSTRLARGLRALGVKAGDTVLTMLDNNVDGVASWFGANLIGAVWVPVNTALKGEFLRHVVEDSRAGVVICEPDLADRFIQIGDELTQRPLVLVRGPEPVNYSANPLVVGALADHEPVGGDDTWWSGTPDDVSFLIYTGGTTGPSKGCVISHGYVFNSARGFHQQTARAVDDLNWSPLPMYHFNLVSGTILGTMLLGGSTAVAPRFSVSGFWPDVQRTGATVVNLLGSMGVLIAQMDDTTEMEACHGQIRIVHGAPFPPDLQATWRTRFGVEQVGANSYGLTEAFPVTTLPYGVPAPPGTSGRRNDGSFDVRIFDDDDNELPDGSVGEVVCRPKRSNVMFLGYWQRPEATAAATRNLWFHTGDLGSFDEEGFFTFVDRKKDYLRRRGENVSSQEMESTYLQHPLIEHVAVHAVASDMTEDDIKVTAVLEPDASLTEVELFEWSKERIPYFALPRYIEFRASLPTSSVGRVHKFQLRDEGCTPNTWDREAEGVSWERR